MSLPIDAFMEIETRNEKRRVLRANASKGNWTYESFAWLEVLSRPYKDRCCILIRRRNWFDKLLKKYGGHVLDEWTTDGNRKYATQPAHDGLYLEAALNDPIEEDIIELLSEIRRLRADIPPPPEPPEPKKRTVKRKPKAGRALPAGARKGDNAIYDTEWEFREWFEDNLDHFGFKRVILSQEPFPDYVIETVDGGVLRVEAELFAANFLDHGHDPNKVDKIVACFSDRDQISGVPVLTANDLREYNPQPIDPKEIKEDLSPTERRVLEIVMTTGGIELSALARRGGLNGDLFLYRRVPPDMVTNFKGKRIQDSLLQPLRRETRQYICKFHHILLGAGLNHELCEALNSLAMKGLIGLKPLDFLSALYDGICVDHQGWVPTEVYATKKARLKFEISFEGNISKKLGV